MSINDPIGDMLTRIRNGQMVYKKSISAIHSNINVEILNVLKAEGYIEDFSVIEENQKKTIEIMLRYLEQHPAITFVSRKSKPGKRIYASVKELQRRFRNGLGIRIITTSKGIKSDLDCIKQRLGGEVICELF